MKSPHAPGELIADKYRLERALGEGGRGEVWEARNVALDVLVAIKLLRGDLDTLAVGRRLLQEARAAARLGHPAIARVFDVGNTGSGEPFVVMELLHGRTLAERIRAEGPLEPRYAVQLLLPIAEALGVAHARGIVHRDVKSESIFVSVEDSRVQPKLLDFGLAQLEGSAPHDPGTTAGEARDSAVDHRTDVRSFCASLCEALTGLVPSRLPARPRVDERLWSIVARGLEKDRDDGWSSMKELGGALAAWLAENGVYEDVRGVSLYAKWLPGQARPRPARRPRSPWRRPFVVAVGLAAFFGVRLTLVRQGSPVVGSGAHVAAVEPLPAPALDGAVTPAREGEIPVIDVEDLIAERIPPEAERQPAEARQPPRTRPARNQPEASGARELIAPY